MRIYFIWCFILIILLFSIKINSKTTCHNITGSCTKNGFKCANGEIVSNDKRCNFINDCKDGSDEYLCEFNGNISIFDNDMFAVRMAIIEISCIKCNNHANTILIPITNHEWYRIAKFFPNDNNIKFDNNIKNEHIILNVYKKYKNNKICCFKKIKHNKIMKYEK